MEELELPKIRLKNSVVENESSKPEEPCYNVVHLKEEKSCCPTNWGAEIPKQEYLIKNNYLSEFGTEEEKNLAKDNLGITEEINEINERIDGIVKEIPLSDWEESDSDDLAFIKNKPELAKIATSGDYDDLKNKPEIPSTLKYYSESDYGGVIDAAINVNDEGFISIYLDNRFGHHSNAVGLSAISPIEGIFNSLSLLGTSDGNSGFHLEIYGLNASGGNINLTSGDLGKLSLIHRTGNIEFVTYEGKKAYYNSNEIATVNLIPNLVLADWEESDSSDDSYIKNKPTNVSEFNNDAGYLTSHQDISGKANKNEMSISTSGDLTTITLKTGTSATVINLHLDISGKADKSTAVGSLSLSLDNTNYKITLSGTKVDGTAFTVSDVIDLPLESVVVSGSYDSVNKKVILTLKNGSTVDFSVADLISGLQSEITSSNKLSADLIQDGTTNKVVTDNEKTTWNNKQTALVSGTNIKTINRQSLLGSGDIQVASSLVLSDWDESDSSDDSFILNKPDLTVYATITYVDAIVGNINTILEEINVGSLSADIQEAIQRINAINGE